MAVPKAEKGNLKEQTVKFLRNTWSELKKVHWPTRREVVVYTLVVLVSVLITTFILWIFDSAFSFLMRLIFFRQG
ncbi:MAG TPA: preprotein translocase subunit SecE [Moorella mulderi]|nr:preprotein translocase subunit SecE [Moorella mulderi]